MDVDELTALREAELRMRAESDKRLSDLNEAIKARGGTVPAGSADGNGNGTEKDPVTAATREQQLAETFLKMSTAEQMSLHDTQHEVWEAMLDAVRKDGERKLFTRKV